MNTTNNKHFKTELQPTKGISAINSNFGIHMIAYKDNNNIMLTVANHDGSHCKNSSIMLNKNELTDLRDKINIMLDGMKGK